MDMKKLTVISLTCLLSILYALFFCPSVYAEVTEEQNFYHWYVVEKTTEDYVNHHGGGGSGGKKKFNAADALATDYGCTTEDIIYNCTGLTRQDYLDYVNQQYGDINAENIFSEAFFGTPVTKSNSQLYATSRSNRIDSEGNINVSGSNFWRSVYNQMFSGGGYKEQYTTETGNDYSIPKYNINIRYVGFCDANYNNSFPDVPKEVVSPYIDSGSYQTTDAILKIEMNGENAGVLGYTVNGYYSEGPWGRFTSGGISRVYIDPNYSNYIAIEFTYTQTGSSGENTTWIRLKVNVSNEDITNQQVPVKQPSQVGFIKYPLGQKTPVYTPDSGQENPFTVNDNGTVSMDEDEDPTTDDTDYPVWVNPDELSDDGWKLLFKYVDDDDNSDNPYNPYNRPWNTQEDGTILGGLFNNLVKDISSMISDLASKIKDILNKLINLPKTIADAIAKFLKDFFGDLSEIDMDVDVENHYNLIQEMYETILELMGVEV